VNVGRSAEDLPPGPPGVARYVPVLMQLLGVTAMAVGFGLLAVWAGLVAGGVGLLAFGVAAELGQGL
jgi:hypothetical protein